MQVYANQLEAQLQNALAPLYLVFGDDDFLRLNALQTIRQYAQRQGFDERAQFIQQQDFRWHDLMAESQNLSLFSSRRLIDLELPSASPGQEGGKFLQQWVKEPPADTLLVLHGPKLKAEQQKTKWFKALSEAGVFVPVFTPDRSRLPAFIQQQAQRYGLQPEPDATQLLVDWFEGNLLALDQALHKLALQHHQGQTVIVTVAMVRQNSDLQSRFDVFSLQEALIKPDPAGFLKRLQRLFETDGEPAIIHWLLQRELTTLQTAVQHRGNPADASRAMQRMGIWKNQQSAYLQRAKNWSAEHSEALAAILWRAELAIKRDTGEDLKTLFAHAGLLLMNPAILALDYLWQADPPYELL